MFRTFLTIVLFGLLFGTVSDASDDIDYPELQVIPRASERLAQESALENKIATHWTYLASGALTLATGLKQNNIHKSEFPSQDDREDALKSTRANLSIGGMTLAAGLGFLLIDSQNQALQNLRKTKGTDRRSELTRERAAEEALQNEARIHSVLSHIVVVLNAGASIAALNSGNDATRGQAAIALGASFLPYLFPERSIAIWEKHKEYKRKIYTPVAQLGFLPEGQSLVPATYLTWSFD
jgi:hypothetical protein